MGFTKVGIQDNLPVQPVHVLQIIESLTEFGAGYSNVDFYRQGRTNFGSAVYTSSAQVEMHSYSGNNPLTIYSGPAGAVQAFEVDNNATTNITSLTASDATVTTANLGTILVTTETVGTSAITTATIFDATITSASIDDTYTDRLLTPQARVNGSLQVTGSTTFNRTNTDYTNANGANSHILLTNPSTTGQTVISSVINGRVAGKLRNDYVGNINYVASGSGNHYFFVGGDYSTGSVKMVVSSSGAVGIGTQTPSAKLQVVGNVIADSFTGSLQGLATTATSASQAEQAVSASQAQQSVSATSATNATTASYVLNAVSSSYALTASYALNAVGAGNPGGTNGQVQYNNNGLFNGVPTLTYAGGALTATGSFTGSFAGAMTGNVAGTASHVNLVAGPGVSVSGLQITADVRTVNGITPVNGNIAVSLAGVLTGTSASLAVSSSGTITGSISNGALWVVSGDATPANNGDVYIYNAGAIGAWLPVAPLDTTAGDARYLLRSGLNYMTGDLDMDGNDIINGGIFFGTAETASFVTASSVFGPYGANSVVSASQAVSASWAPGVAAFPYVGDARITGSLRLSGSLVQGLGTTVAGIQAVAQGWYTQANGNYSHAEGYGAITTADWSHAEGLQTTTTGIYTHAEGENTNADGQSSHAEGQYTNALGPGSHAEGYRTRTTLFGSNAHTEGYFTTASNIAAHAEGSGSQATGVASHAEGWSSLAAGTGSHAEGTGTQAGGNYAHAEGSNANAGGNYSHAEGSNTVASGVGAHAEGSNTAASAQGAHAEGSATIARGQFSHAEGLSTVAVGDYSHASGREVIASGSYQAALGKFNMLGNTTSLFVIGDGFDASTRHDILRVDSGSIGVTGSLNVTGSLTVNGTAIAGVNTTNFINTGSSISSVQSMTGSLKFTGSIAVTGSIGATNAVVDNVVGGWKIGSTLNAFYNDTNEIAAFPYLHSYYNNAGSSGGGGVNYYYHDSALGYYYNNGSDDVAPMMYFIKDYSTFAPKIRINTIISDNASTTVDTLQGWQPGGGGVRLYTYNGRNHVLTVTGSMLARDGVSLGTKLTNTHIITGSVSMTGSLTVNGQSVLSAYKSYVANISYQPSGPSAAVVYNTIGDGTGTGGSDIVWSENPFNSGFLYADMSTGNPFVAGKTWIPNTVLDASGVPWTVSATRTSATRITFRVTNPSYPGSMPYWTDLPIEIRVYN